MNNSNFGYDCRNNLNNSKFVLIFDELKELTYVERYQNIFDPKFSQFVTTDLIKQNIEETYNDKLVKLDKEDKFYQIKLGTLNTERLTNLEVAKSFENKQKKKTKLTLNDYDDRKNKALRNQKIKRLDLSADFWKKFDVQNKKSKKQVGLFEIQNIDKPNIITIALNPKEFYERFNDHSDNKRHKGLHKSTRGMDFDSYSERLSDLNEFSRDYIKKPKKIYKKGSKLYISQCK